MSKESTVLVSGVFNILHPGHMRLLKFARNFGKKLIVVIEGDIKAGDDAFISEKLRLEAVQSHNLVSESFISDESIEKIINRIQPDIVVKGKEHELLQNPELEVVQFYGGRLIFSSGETFFSSVDLIKKDIKEIDAHSIFRATQSHQRKAYKSYKKILRIKNLCNW